MIPSVQEACPIPYQAANERVHGVEPNWAAQDHWADAGAAQRWDLQVSWQEVAGTVSGNCLTLSLSEYLPVWFSAFNLSAFLPVCMSACLTLTVCLSDVTDTVTAWLYWRYWYCDCLTFRLYDCLRLSACNCLTVCLYDIATVWLSHARLSGLPSSARRRGCGCCTWPSSLTTSTGPGRSWRWGLTVAIGL